MTRGMLLEGRNFRLALEADSYEYPEVESGPDAHWVRGSVELQMDPNPRVSVALEISWRTEELDAFNTDLQGLIEGRARVAKLTHLERRRARGMPFSNDLPRNLETVDGREPRSTNAVRGGRSPP